MFGSDLEAAAAWLNERGFVVNNCFQVEGRWRVNVRRKDWATAPGTTHHFVTGNTLAEALSELISERMTAEARLEDAFAVLIDAMRGNHGL